MSSLDVYSNKLRVKELVFCPAKAIFNRLNFQKQPMNKKMRDGEAFEEYIARNIFREEENWLHNFRIEYAGLIEGHPDFVNFQLQKIIEIKNRKTLEIKTYDIAQAGCYANMLGFKNFTIMVGFLNGDNSIIVREKVFPTNEEIFRKFVEHAKRLRKQIEEGQVWEEQWDYCPRYEWECSYCVYKNSCPRGKREK